jgi:hypothetical protein
VVGKKFYKLPDLKQQLISFIEQFKAGSPTNPDLYWVNKKPKEIASAFNEVYQEKVSNRSVKRLLNELGYHYRSQIKELATGKYALRNEQFSIIFNLALVMSLQSPVISIDCKKKEKLGNFYRKGKIYTQEPIKVYDHDYEHLAEGKIVPHGIYDLQANKGCISIGNSAETADFVADNLLWWWSEYGIHLYPDTQNILVFCDAGGANSYRHYVLKIECFGLLVKLENHSSFVIIHHMPLSGIR